MLNFKTFFLEQNLHRGPNQNHAEYKEECGDEARKQFIKQRTFGIKYGVGKQDFVDGVIRYLVNMEKSYVNNMR